jgi:predicted transcriptional regulator
MSAFTVNLPKERARELKELAARYGIPPEELVRASIEDMLMQPEEQFQKVAEHVLKKNADLYRRLSR